MRNDSPPLALTPRQFALRSLVGLAAAIVAASVSLGVAAALVSAEPRSPASLARLINTTVQVNSTMMILVIGTYLAVGLPLDMLTRTMRRRRATRLFVLAGLLGGAGIALLLARALQVSGWQLGLTGACVGLLVAVTYRVVGQAWLKRPILLPVTVGAAVLLALLTAIRFSVPV